MKSLIATLITAFVLSVVITTQAVSDIKIDGSSTIYPITETVAYEFRKAENWKTKVKVGISGTTGGFRKFFSGEVDINNASRPINRTEIELCKKKGIEYIELPVAYDGIAVVVNPKNNWVDYLSVKELKMIWQPESKKGTIRKWSQIRSNWPNKRIRLYAPGIDSGTYDYFTKAIVGEEGAKGGDYTSTEDDNLLIFDLATDTYALGFFGMAYHENHKDRLKLVPIDDEKGSNGKGAIRPTYDNVAKGTYQPLARPLFIYINKKSAAKPEVKRFIEFYMKHGARISKEAGYVALPEKAYGLALERFEKGATGSVFDGGGSQVGVKIEDILKRY